MSAKTTLASYMWPKNVIAVGAVLPGLATIAVSLRFYARKIAGTHIGADDWLILCSLILTIGLGVMLIAGEPELLTPCITLTLAIH